MASGFDSLSVFFKNLGLLRQALVHPSYAHESPSPENTESNERLEFLGDAVLTFVISAWLFPRYPDVDEGFLTRLRSFLVRGETLASISAELGLGDELYLGQGEEQSGGRLRSANLANVYEAVVGAVYLDGGIQAAWKLIEATFDSRLTKLSYEEGTLDHKSLLQEKAQNSGHGAPFYRVVSVTGLDHAREYAVEVLVGGQTLGYGSGSNKRGAEMTAAAMALARLAQT